METKSILGLATVVIALAGAGLQAFAQEELAPGELELELSGDHEMTLCLPAERWSYEGAATAPSGSSLIGLRARSGELALASEWKVVLAPGAAGASASATLSGGENAIYWSPGELRLGLGWQYFSWGAADGFNPTDNLNPRDYSKGMEAEKLPALALSAACYPTESLSLQAVLKPVEEASRFPVDAEASLRSAAGAYLASFNALFSSSLEASVSRLDPDYSPSSFVAGARAAFASSAVDLSLSYLYDWDRYYTPLVGLGANAQGYFYPASIRLEKKRLHRLGLDAKTVAGPFGLWVESALSLPEGYMGGSSASRGASLEWTVGADRSFGPGSSFYANLQVLGQYLPDFYRGFGSDYPGGKPLASMTKDESYMQTYFERSTVQASGGQTEGLLLGLAMKLEFPLADETLAPSLAALYLLPQLYDEAAQTRYGSLGLEPELDLRPLDSFHIRLGARLCYAWAKASGGSVELLRSGDRLGLFTDDNRVYLKFEYSWRSLP
jgi:hypothetical protein